MRTTLQFLRPCLRSRCRPSSIHLRVHNATNIKQSRRIHVGNFENLVSLEQLSGLIGSRKESYPRILASKSVISCQNFVEKYEHLERGESVDGKCFTVHGMFACVKPADNGLCL